MSCNVSCDRKYLRDIVILSWFYLCCSLATVCVISSEGKIIFFYASSTLTVHTGQTMSDRPRRGVLIAAGAAALAIGTALTTVIILKRRSRKPSHGDAAESNPHTIPATVSAPLTEALKTPAAEKPKEPVAEKPKEHVAEKPKEPVAEKPKEHVAEKPKEHVAEKPKEHVAEKPKEPVAEKPKEHVAEKPKEHVAEMPKALVAEKPKEHVAEKPKEPVAEKPKALVAEKSKEHVAEKPKEPVAEKPKEHVAEKPKEPVAEKPKEHVAEKPTEHVAEKPKEPVAEKPKEHVAEKPKEHVAEKPKEHVAEKPKEHVAEKPKEPVAEKPREEPAAESACCQQTLAQAKSDDARNPSVRALEPLALPNDHDLQRKVSFSKSDVENNPAAVAFVNEQAREAPKAKSKRQAAQFVATVESPLAPCPPGSLSLVDPAPDSYHILGLTVPPLEGFVSTSREPLAQFPLVTLRLKSTVHEGLELAMLAEDLNPVQGPVTTELFVKRSLVVLEASFALQAPDAMQIIHDGPSDSITPSVFERYLDLLVYRSEDPADAVIVACLFVVRDRIGYAMQLTIPQQLYDATLPVLLEAAQKTTIDDNWSRSLPVGGRIIHTFECNGAVFEMRSPVEYVRVRPSSPATLLTLRSHHQDSELVLVAKATGSAESECEVTVGGLADTVLLACGGTPDVSMARRVAKTVRPADSGTIAGVSEYSSPVVRFHLPHSHVSVVCEHRFGDGLLSIILDPQERVPGELQVGLIFSDETELTKTFSAQCCLSDESAVTHFDAGDRRWVAAKGSGSLGEDYIMRCDAFSMGEDKWLGFRWIVPKSLADFENCVDEVLTNLVIRV